ncbi:MAG: transposase [Paludibacter sp.]|nr:transposase [Paludibacter sp.]
MIQHLQISIREVWSTFTDISFPVQLQKGYNTIRISNQSGWLPDIDKIEFDFSEISAGIINASKKNNKNIFVTKSGKNSMLNILVHESDVQCISKCKEHKKHEFGNKVSIIYTQTTGVIIRAMGFRNPYDGHTIEPALEQAERLLGKRTIKTLIGDRGYKGKRQVKKTTIEVPKPFSNKKQTQYQQNKLKKQFKRRAAIEPINGHLKNRPSLKS